MLEEPLVKLGFSPSEIKVYLFLLKNESSYPNKISAATKINRSNIYEALDRLIAKGVVSFIVKNGIKWFEARSTDSIFSLVNHKKEELEFAKNEIAEELRNIKKDDKNALEASIFVGKKGLRMIFEEMLKEKKSISLIASEMQFSKVFGSYFDLWHKQRIEKKISQRSIFPAKFKGKLEERKYLEYKFVSDKFVNPTTTIIYGDECVFIQWSDEPLAIKMSNSGITQSHLNYFNLLWKSADA